MYKKLSGQEGFSVVEAVIAAAVLALYVSALVGGLIYYNRTAPFLGNKARAVFLAEEALEAARNIRDNNFAALTNGSYGLSRNGSFWSFSGSSDQTDIFTRQLTISTVNDSVKQLEVTVNWSDGGSSSGSITLNSYLTYWQESVQAVESCSAFCESLEYSGGTCRQNTVQCSNNNETYEADGDAYCTSGPSADTCCCQ